MQTRLKYLEKAENEARKDLQPTFRTLAVTSSDEMLSEYKAQQSCERGFRFLKDPLFFADSVFLKSPERIEAMAMIMGLCLLIYTLAQKQIRKSLSASKSTLKINLVNLLIIQRCD